MVYFTYRMKQTKVKLWGWIPLNFKIVLTQKCGCTWRWNPHW